MVEKPRRALSSARAHPRRPEERLPMKRIASMASCVGPAVMSKRGRRPEASDCCEGVDMLRVSVSRALWEPGGTFVGRGFGTCRGGGPEG